MLLQAEATVDLQTKVENRVLLSIVVKCTVMHCTISTPHNIPGNVKFREHIQQITGADVLGKKLICVLEACTFRCLGTLFKIGQRMQHSLKSKLQ